MGTPRKPAGENQYPPSKNLNKILKDLCFFLPSGATFYFKGCIITEEDADTVRFEYISQSNGRYKEACFDKTKCVGLSQT